MSENKRTFTEVVEINLDTLDLFTKAITRAHGESHPETFEVRELFECMQEKIAETEKSMPNLEKEFIRLRQVTDHYTIPNGVCQTYAGTYNLLAELDEVYHIK